MDFKTGFEAVSTGWSLLKSTGEFLRNVERKVLILGASGTGKSSFLTELRKRDAKQLSTSATTKERVFKWGKSVLFVDTPGHSTLANDRLKTIKEASVSDSLLIVNVVANGYHEPLTTGTKPPRAQKGAVPDSYLRRMRKREIELIDEYQSLLIKLAVKVPPVITLINKADLWWTPKIEEEIVKSYLTGEYAKAMGSTNHYVRPTCFTQKRFFNKFPMTGYVGDQERLKFAQGVEEVFKRCLN